MFNFDSNCIRMPDKELQTEEKIKLAARKIFQEKGFEGAKTRDIAKEAGINLALMNYYFRSKKALFEMIMMETVQEFFQMVFQILNKSETSLMDKIDGFVETYIETLKKNPEVPLFILSCVKSNQVEFQKKFSMFQMISELHFFKQFQELVKQGKVKNIHPAHFLMNLAGMIVFPFVASPMIKLVTQIPESEFDLLMDQRKKMVPLWLKDMLFKTTLDHQTNE
ncbi:MAG: HTH-type transcriptional repressor KstR2 [Bacteroidota bacterium]